MHFFPRLAVILFVSAWPLSFAAAQQLQCTPCSHGYGQVRVGTTAQYSFQLTNTGTKALHITSKWKSGAAFRFGNFPLPITLNAGKSTMLPIIFKPTAAGKVTGAITIVSDALNPKLRISVWGTGVTTAAPKLGVSPSSLNFGSVNVGSTANLTLTLTASNGSVTVSSVRSSSAEFTVPGLVLPLTLAAGQSAPVVVAFLPVAAGTASANLTIVSNASNSPNTVSMTGAGVVAGAHRSDLMWNASRDPVIGYNVYRGGRQGGPYTQINSVLEASTSYTDNNVTGGATYYYVVTAVDANNLESGYSNEVKVVIPSP